MFGLKGALALGLGNGIIYSLVFILVNLVVAALGEGQDPHDSNPWQLLTTDRSVTVARTGATTLVVLLLAICLALGSGSPDALVNGLIIGFVLGVLAGLVRMTLSSWGSWLVFTRLWLPLTGRLPWRPKRFLEDAHDRGVLRQVGAAYQFRHAQLRDHLAAHHPASRTPTQ